MLLLLVLRDLVIKYLKVYIIKIGSVCLCHGYHAIGRRRYFLAHSDNRPPATPAQIPLGDTLYGYRTVVLVSSALQAVVCIVQHY